MKFNSYNIFFIAMITILSFLIGIRDYSIGTDTKNYVYIFLSNSDFRGFEPLMNLLIKSIHIFTNSPIFFLFSCAFIINFFYAKAFISIPLSSKKNLAYVFLFIVLLLSSSWYFTSITNGIRQGISLSILYYAILRYLINNRYFIFWFYFVVSCMFHYSTILLLPVILLYIFVSFRVILFIWILLAFFYIIGINEMFIKKISDWLSIPLYTMIKNYGLSVHEYYGFDIRFFIYTIIFPIVSLLVYNYKRQDMKIILIVNKVYLILSMPYFLFGFSNFSNRYALMAWGFIPFLEFIIINQFIELKSNKDTCFLAALASLFVIYFYLFKLNIGGLVCAE